MDLMGSNELHRENLSSLWQGVLELQETLLEGEHSAGSWRHQTHTQFSVFRSDPACTASHAAEHTVLF